MLVGAPVEILIAGRGTGKTEGVLAPKSVICYLDAMPRSTGVIVGATYSQILTRTLPGMVKGWEMLGYKRDVHFIVGKTPPEAWKKMWNWQGPWRMPFRWNYVISWWNGAIIYLVSQDIIGSSNGITIDWIIGDEAKFLNQERFRQELLPANRGIMPAYRHKPYHHGITLTTDMPTGTSGLWLFEYEKECDKQRVKEILKLQLVINKLRAAMEFVTKKNREYYVNQIEVINEEINDLRRGLIFYHEASSLDNIHALGLDYIKQQLQLTTLFEFDTQILNLRPQKVEDGFYPDFDEEYHGYFGNNNFFLEKLNYNFEKLEKLDCRKDGDLADGKPLHIAIDYNRRIHPMVIAQNLNDEIRIVNALYVLFPQKLKDVVQKFCDYYEPLKKKLVYYWYDQTAVGEMNETRQCDDVVSILRKNGWSVVPMYMRLAPLHQDKYNMYGHLLQEDGVYPKKLRVNRENCSQMIRSVNLSEAEIKKGGFGKKKKSEKDPNFPAKDATHFSDAMDMLVWGLLESKLSSTAGIGTSLVMGRKK